MPPFQSQKQRAKFGELVKEGKITQKKFDEWQAATGDKELPERVAKPKKQPGIIKAIKGTK